MRVAGRGAARPGLAHATRAITGPESLAFVKAVVTPPEMGKDLVTDGPHPGGEVVDAQPVADEGGKVAAANGAGGEIRDVDRQQVHRYPPGERTTLFGDNDLGRRLASGGAARAQDAVRITDGDDRDPARPSRGESGAVPDGFALLDCAHLDDAALELHHRAHRIGLARGGIDAVKRDTGPNEVAIRALAEEYARGIGERGRHAAVEHANVAKQPDLSSIHRVIGRLGAGEMAHHQRETVIFGL